MNLQRNAPSILATVLALALAGCAQQQASAPASPLAHADGAAGSDSAAAAGPAPGATAAPSAAQSVAPIGTQIPRGFSSYASESTGDNRRCVAGAASDEDGMNQRPVVYLAQASGKPIWVHTLALPADTYQSRATHCLRQGDALYVLLQSDTQPAQTLSQTRLRVVKLDLAAGAMQAGADVVVADAQGAYSAQVDEGADRLRWENGGVVVSGRYFPLDAPDQRKEFATALKADLSR